MEVAIVGCGHIAERYAEGFDAADRLEFVAAVDLDRERAERLAGPYGAAAYADAESLLADRDVSLIANLTSHAAHASVTRTCLEAGRHVYSEKPLAMDAETARDLVALADERGVRLGCAPISLMGDAQQHAWRYLREGRLGTVRAAYAECNVGRLTEWNSNPEPFLRAGPLYDAAVYPLSVLVGFFGPVERVTAAHGDLLLAEHAYDGRRFSVETPDHVVATLECADGVSVRLTASMYVPYRTKSFYGLEIHGDDGSLYLDDAADFTAPRTPPVEFARLGREYRPVPLAKRPEELEYASGVLELAEAVVEGRPHYPDGARAAHLVEVIEAIERCADTGGSIDLDTTGFERPEPLAKGDRTRTTPEAAPDALSMPPIGFGCSRYRGGDTYVDLRESIEHALDVGYRLFDSAELYGNEGRIGEIVARSGSPDRDALFVVSKVWNTNHAPEHVRAACESTCSHLGLETLDCYMLHWPDAWAHRGPLDELAELSHEEATALTFPTDEGGEPLEADVTLAETWRAMERLRERGRTRTLGVSNFDRAELTDLLAIARIPPSVVQIKRDPYEPNDALVEFCHERSIRVMAHSPLSAAGLLDEPALEAIAAEHGVTPAQVVLRWNIERDVVPIPSSTRPEHVTENLDVFGFELSAEERTRIDALDGSD